MPTMDELQATNANFEEQMTTWRQQRYADGENPLDWTAFREHLRSSAPPIRGKRRRTSFTLGRVPDGREAGRAGQPGHAAPVTLRASLTAGGAQRNRRGRPCSPKAPSSPFPRLGPPSGWTGWANRRAGRTRRAAGWRPGMLDAPLPEVVPKGRDGGGDAAAGRSGGYSDPARSIAQRGR